MKIDPYLNFDGQAEEAIAFYEKAVGAKVTRLMRFKDCPEPPPSGQFPPEIINKVMHASLLIGDATILVSDGHCTGQSKFSGISLALSAPSDADATRMFLALAEGGTITMPLTKTFFSSIFGMVTDRFGVAWMVLVER